MSEDVSSTIESIPVPPCPTSKSSKEILCELFSAFNAKPPLLDDITSQDTKSTISDKSNKKHKKHSKKKHKKVKKKSRSSSSDSSNSVDLKKKARKKHKKHKSNHKTSDSDQKKKKSKLGKYSASDADSDEEPQRKKIKEEKVSKSDDISLINIKKEKQSKEDCPNNLNDTNSIQNTILKHAVSKIVDKVIDSTIISTDVSSSKNSITIIQCDDKRGKKPYKATLPGVIKSEPTAKEQHFSQNMESNRVGSHTEKTLVDKETFLADSNKSANELSKQPLSVADVFAEDLLDNGIGSTKDNPSIIGNSTFCNF